MKKKWISLLSAIFLAVTSCLGQDCSCPDVPNEASWATARDFKKSEKKIEECLEWLHENGLTECKNYRESINSYVLLWLSECPYLTVHLRPEVLPFLDEYPDLLFVMIHGVASYQLKHPKETDQQLIHAKGLEYLTEVVKGTRKFEEKKDFRELQKLRRKGRLGDYVRSHWK